MFPLVFGFADILFGSAVVGALAVGKLLYDTVSKQRKDLTAYRVTVTDAEGHKFTRDISSLSDLEKVTQEAAEEMALTSK